MGRSIRLLTCASLVICAACGCSVAAVQSKAPASGGPMEIFRPSALMYLAPDPYRTICLEIDAVEGAEPKDEDINALVEFLEKYCQKPVTVVRKAAIPRSAAKGLLPSALAFGNIRGPGQGGEGGPSAYMYLLFYDSSGEKKLPDDYLAAPYANASYPCAIFVDMSYWWLGKWMLSTVLKHEAGHLLGLCGNRAHGDGQHCSDKKCIMYKSVSMTGSLLGLGPRDLCEECQRDLAAQRESGAECNLEFRGPFLIRKEKEYYVAQLPSYVFLSFTPLESFDLEAIDQIKGLALERFAKVTRQREFGFSIGIEVASRADFLRQRPAIQAAMKDPNPAVVYAAEKLKEEMERRFGALPAAQQGPP